ncbi:hypothetical protein [uncultured Albimonas sp.]|uniref:hypothetical protein n=1 Tax=uncultured Albimonas sp. TaxID=1331701 RepID=UPI0030EEBD32
MKASIVGPLGMGALAGIAGAVGAAGAGWPILGCLAAYSLCGATGLLGGAVLNYRIAMVEEAREIELTTALADTAPRRRFAGVGG